MVAKRTQVFASLTRKVLKTLILQGKKDTMQARKYRELNDILLLIPTDYLMGLQ